jgi:Domain of unknown function (DUF222)
MCSIPVPAEVFAALDALNAAVIAIRELDFDSFGPLVRLHALGQLETEHRRQVAVSHDVIASLANEEPATAGGPVHKVIADWLRISYAEARRRLRDAQQLSRRVTLTGQELPPDLPATADESANAIVAAGDCHSVMGVGYGFELDEVEQ